MQILISSMKMDYLLTVEGTTGTVSNASVRALIAGKLTASRAVAGYFMEKEQIIEAQRNSNYLTRKFGFLGTFTSLEKSLLNDFFVVLYMRFFSFFQSVLCKFV